MKGHGLAHAGAEQKQADDAGPLHGPQRVAVEVVWRLQQPEVIQVEAEVESRHPDDRQPTQRVQAVETFGTHSVFS